MMRRAFIAYDTAPTLEQAHDYAPWAFKVIEVEGGFMAFESFTDYEMWERNTDQPET